MPLLALLMPSCVKEPVYLSDSSVRLEFSADTVAFDTVFVTMGTTTRMVKVYNRYSEPILIDAVTLRGGTSSRFRINVDGDTSFVARDIALAAHDSLFIFVQACINPSDQTSPFLVEDAILFRFNNREQELPLTAYGRNAVYHQPDHLIRVPSVDSQGRPDTIDFPYSVIDCDQWDHTKPHVIFGYAVVDSDTKLQLHSGDELYFANDAYLWVYDGGTLDARGSREQPVLFTSLRHDGYYDTLPGQWGYVWLSTGSKDNYMEWVRIENGTAGVVADTNVGGNPTLDIRNSVIENHSYSGLVGQGAWLVGDNLLVANCGVTLLQLRYGGRYRFTSSTFANYWRYDSRTSPAVVVNNYYYSAAGDLIPRDLQEATFANCIIYGTYVGADSVGELLADDCGSALFQLSLDHCLLKSFLIDSADLPAACLLVNRDPQFIDPRGSDYHLGESSPARGSGSATALKSSADLDGVQRGSPPCIGAYEYVPQPEKRRHP